MALKENKIKNSIIDFVNYFNSNDIPYVLIGGLAVNIWGRIRSTLDVDFIFDHNKTDLGNLFDYLITKGYNLNINDIELGIKERINIIIWSGTFRIDIKGIYNNFAKKSVEMAHKVKLFNQDINVDCPELLIVSKICYGSEQDFEDAASIYLRLKNQNKLKIDILEQFVNDLEIEDRIFLLKKLLKIQLNESELEEAIDNLKPFDFNKF